MVAPLIADVRPCPAALITRAGSSHLDRAVGAGELVRVDRGTYVAAAVWSALPPWDRYLVRVHAVAARHPEAVFVRDSAAALRGLAVFGEPAQVHAVFPHLRRTRPAGSSRFHAAERMPKFEVLGGLRVATTQEIASDAARLSHPAVALAIVDSALRIDPRLEVDTIRTLSDTHPSSRGRSRARWVCDRASALTESPLESVSMAVIEWIGFPRPELQVWFRGAGADDRVDFFWPDRSVVGEADGEVKYSGAMGDARESIRARTLRDGRLLRKGVGVVRHWGWTDVRDVAPLRATLLSAGIPIERPTEHAPLATLRAALQGH